MNRFVSIVFFLVFILPSFGQVKKLDKLEILYAQGHYKMVYRKSVRLLNMPDYDFSALPSYYKALSLFQLAQQDSWIEKPPHICRTKNCSCDVARDSLAHIDLPRDT
jgi:hypothetical protein